LPRRFIVALRKLVGTEDGHSFVRFHTMLPNKSPEPTAVGAVSSAIAVHVVSRRWLSFFR
jgi:hypothetical protein